MATEVQPNGTVVTTTTGSEDDIVKLPEGVEIMTSNTNKLELNTGDDPVEDPTGTSEIDPETNPEVDPDAKLEADVQAVKKAEEDLKGDLAGKGVDFAVLEAEFTADGKLSEASYKALENAGYPRSAVDAYTTGLVAQANQFVARVTEIAGGPEELQAVSTFIAGQGEAYINAFNKAIDDGSVKQLELIIKGAKADMVTKYGTASDTTLGKPAGSVVVGFKTQAEMITAMSDPRYARDDAYTKATRAKVQASQGLF